MPSFGRSKNPTPSPQPVPNPDPATSSTITTTIPETHSPVSRNIEQVTVPQSSTAKTAADLSPNTKTVLKLLLESLGQIPIPEIREVTRNLSQVINGVQNIPQVEAGWKGLAKRIACLTFLLRQISAAPELQDEPMVVEQHCTPLKVELRKLAEDIHVASKQGRLLNFFDSTGTDAPTLAAHEKLLDGIANDLTMALCMHTSLTKVELNAQLDHTVSQLHISSDASPSPDGATIDITGNLMLDEVLGSVASNNQLHGESMRIKMTNNLFLGKVHGPMLSDNTVGVNRVDPGRDKI